MWLDVAKTLNVNGKIRIQCCRDDNSMIVGRTASKLWCYCHRCKESRSVSVGLRSIKDIINDKRLLQELKTQSPQNRLPKLTETPADAAVWYLKYGISNADVSKYGIGYSQKYKRVCIPLAQNAGMQMRAVYPYQEPKYLNVELKPNAYKSLVFDTGRRKGDKITICVEVVILAITRFQQHCILPSSISVTALCVLALTMRCRMALDDLVSHVHLRACGIEQDAPTLKSR